MKTRLSRLALVLASGIVLACESTTTGSPGTGSLEISAVIVGADLDADGFTVSIDAAGPVRVSNGNTTTRELAPGFHQIAVSDIAANCAVDGTSGFQVNVPPGGTTKVTVTLVCHLLVPPPTNLWVYATSIGQTDADGFLVAIDNGTPKPVGGALAAAFADISPGLHSLTLSGLATNCTTATPTASVNAVAGVTSQFVFNVKCHYPIPNALVFTSTRANGFSPQLYFRSAAGAVETQVLPVLNTYWPVVSPGGDQIGYTLVTGPNDLRVVDLDGSNDHSVLFPSIGEYPAWSPNGLRLALNDNGGNLWIVNADGTNRVQLNPQFTRWVHPSWSPDGARIVISKEGQLGTVNPDGTGFTDISHHQPGAWEDYAVWSPNGTQIAYLTAQIGVWTYSLHVMAPDGSGDITIHTGVAPGISWAPDGTRLAFCGTNGKVGVVDTGGGNLQFFGGSRGIDCSPRWSPDGSAIAFTSTRDGNSEIYVMNPDGTGLRNATLSPANETMFSWVP